MRRLRTRLMLVFVAATLAPLLITVWISLALLGRSLAMSPTRELEEASRALETTGRELYRRACVSLERDAAEGRVKPAVIPASGKAAWAPEWRQFWESQEQSRFALGGQGGGRLDYLVRSGSLLRVYSAPLGGVQLGGISEIYARARAALGRNERRDLRRGFSLTLLFLAAGIWVVSFGVLMYWAHRISHPIRQLTTGLGQVAAGNLTARVAEAGDDEIGDATHAFNQMAGQLERSRDRLVYVTRLESWQALARKTAHEVKNSLTPIRLTMEEIAARGADSDPEFLEQATQIVVDEVLGLERRVRAFSELASEPPVSPRPLDVNALIEERIALLRAAHPEVAYHVRLAGERPRAMADEDLLKGVLTNLLENAAQAASSGGVVLSVTDAEDGRVRIEVHDSGPGLSAAARQTLFEPTISFKKGGMGLGLSIARKSALLSGGDIQLVRGELGGAAFRVLLPRAS